MRFGELLRSTRLRLDVTAEAVAMEIGVHLSTVCRWERGEWWPSDDQTVVKISRFLGVDPSPMLVAVGTERGGYMLPLGDDARNEAAAIIAAAWLALPLETAQRLARLSSGAGSRE